MLLGSVLLSLSLSTTPVRQPLPLHAAELPSGATRTAATGTEPMYLAFTLKMQDRAGLEQLLADQQDPTSPTYRQFLTPESFGARFGWPSGRYQGLVDYLTAQGLQVRSYPNQLFVRVLGTAAQVEKLLGVRMFNSQSGKLRFYSYAGTPTLPASLAEMVEAVGGLDTRFHPRHQALDSQGNATFGPADLRAFYDMNAIHTAGTTGTKATCAMLGTYPESSVAFKASDITTFYTQYSNATTQLVQDAVRPASQQDYDSQQGLDVEESMDAEMPTVSAPGLASETMVLVGASELFSTGIQQVVNNHPTINSISVSFGGCEGDVEQSDATAADDAFAQGAAEGQAWFIAAGDNGVTGCINATGSAAAVSGFPSDSPHVVSVGGTMFKGTFNSSNAVTAWGSESAWNETIQGQQVAGGGGASTLFAHPAWQTGPGTSTSHGREQPDVAMLANVTPGIAINVSSQGGYVGIGNGTSAAAPLTAGIFALIADHGGTGCMLGLPNTTIYQLGTAQQQGGAAAFHDITSGNISVNGTTGPSAGTGYDEATGWGSIDVSAMVAAYPACGESVVTTGTTASTTSTTNGSSGIIVFPTTGTNSGTTSTTSSTTSTSSSSGTTGTTAASTSTSSSSSSSGTTGSLPSVATGDICAACASAADCPHSGEQCVILGSGGFCAPPCITNSQCGAGNTCTPMTDPEGHALLGCFPTAQTCPVTETTVPTGDVCATCGSAADCPHSGEQCVFEDTGSPGYCAPACTEDSQCGSGNLCTAMSDSSGHTLHGCYPSTETCSKGGKSSGTGSSTGSSGYIGTHAPGTGGCSSAPASTWGLFSLLALAGLGRRRRDAR